MAADPDDIRRFCANDPAVEALSFKDPSRAFCEALKANTALKRLYLDELCSLEAGEALGEALKTKLNTALKNESLKESTGVTAPATGSLSGSTAARSTASIAQMLVAALSLAVFARM